MAETHGSGAITLFRVLRPLEDIRPAVSLMPIVLEELLSIIWMPHARVDEAATQVYPRGPGSLTCPTRGRTHSPPPGTPLAGVIALRFSTMTSPSSEYCSAGCHRVRSSKYIYHSAASQATHPVRSSSSPAHTSSRFVPLPEHPRALFLIRSRHVERCVRKGC